MRKFLLTITLLLTGLYAGAQELDWRMVPIDASRTGVRIPTADDIPEAIGTFKGNKYIAPNGRKFSGTVAQVARLMTDAQPSMAFVKEIVCQCAAPMASHRPQSELSNLIVDRLMIRAAEVTGKRIDVGITNFGGIRTDFPQGNIILDDVLSMLPFKNYITYICMPGSELRRVFEQMAAGTVQVVGGVELVMRNGRLVKALVQGKPLDDKALYGVASVDFLLDGGDGINLARGAKSVIISDCLMRDSLLPYLRELGQKGEMLSYHLDNRITIEQ